MVLDAVVQQKFWIRQVLISDLKVKDWTDDQAAKIREIIGAEYKVEGDLRSEVQLNIKRLMDIGCYRGVRHRIGSARSRPEH